MHFYAEARNFEPEPRSSRSFKFDGEKAGISMNRVELTGLRSRMPKCKIHGTGSLSSACLCYRSCRGY